MPYTQSADGTSLYFESHGEGGRSLLFVHGWQGNSRWWDHQLGAFPGFRLVFLDLGGHGKSAQTREQYSVRAYAEDIWAVAEALNLHHITLVGHSMSGSHVVEAYGLMPERVERIVLVDTLHNLNQMPTMEELGPFFEGMRADYPRAVEMGFRQYMFRQNSPPEVVNRVIAEASARPVELSIKTLSAFYQTDIRPAASRVEVPVRAINSDLLPTQAEANKKYFHDFAYEVIPAVGHYPMLEKPAEFNAALARALER
jgi:pimeloyl-ACP methyl ester carboxylesterase